MLTALPAIDGNVVINGPGANTLTVQRSTVGGTPIPWSVVGFAVFFAGFAVFLHKTHRGRALYAITPRFAITSTDAQLEAAGALVREFPECHVQTHLCENRREIEASCHPPALRSR